MVLSEIVWCVGQVLLLLFSTTFVFFNLPSVKCFYLVYYKVIKSFKRIGTVYDVTFNVFIGFKYYYLRLTVLKMSKHLSYTSMIQNTYLQLLFTLCLIMAVLCIIFFCIQFKRKYYFLNFKNSIFNTNERYSFNRN